MPVFQAYFGLSLDNMMRSNAQTDNNNNTEEEEGKEEEGEEEMTTERSIG